MIRLKWKGCIYMPRNKMKPEYDAELTMQMLMDEVVSLYDPSDGHGLSIRQIAEELDMTILKVRKILISAGVFSSEICDRIIELKKEGKEIPEIQKITGLSRASVHSYLPYVKIVYNAREISLNAERIRVYRKRKELVKLFGKIIKMGNTKEIEKKLWELLSAFEGYPFYTEKGLRYTYKIKNNKMLIDKGEIQISDDIIYLFLRDALGDKKCLNKLNQQGISTIKYIGPLFVKFGLLEKKDE